MKTKKKKITAQTRNRKAGAKKTLKKTNRRTPGVVAKKKAGTVAARTPKRPPETQEPAVAVYEVVETRVYEEPEIEVEVDEEFGT